MDDFSKLTYMQHYGLPTCLLDITSNALVALYFACSKIYYLKNFKFSHNEIKESYTSLRKKCINKNECTKTNYVLTSPKYDGIVYLLIPKISNNERVLNRYIIYNNYSDTVSILSTLALLKHGTKISLLKDFNDFNNFINNKDIGEKSYNIFYLLLTNNKMSKNRFRFSYSEFVFDIKGLRNDPRSSTRYINLLLKSSKELYSLQLKCERIANKYFSILNSYEMINFLHKVRQNVGDFDPLINLKNILKPVIVQPALNNRRVESQQGYFIFENPLYFTDKQYKNESNAIFNSISKSFKMLKIYIPNIYKSKILTELDDNFNISKETLFPDPETVAQYMSDKFKQFGESTTNSEFKNSITFKK